jgi:hypothetical protein
MRGHGLATRAATTASERLGINMTATLGAAAGILLLGLGAFGFGAVSPVNRSDQISSGQAAMLVAGFRNASGSLMSVDLPENQERSKLLDSLNLTKPQAERLLTMVDRGERTLGWLTLWDNSDEDGDIASVTAGGITQHVALTRAPTRILVAAIPGQPVYVTGERDGMGGGITLSIELSTGPLPLPPLAVGQTVALPIQ